MVINNTLGNVLTKKRGWELSLERSGHHWLETPINETFRKYHKDRENTNELKDKGTIQNPLKELKKKWEESV